MKCVAIQFPPAWENVEKSRGLIADLLAEAGDLSGALVVLPEMAESGFTNHPEHCTDGKSERFACDQSRKHGCFLQHGFTHAVGSSFQNRVALASPEGKIIARYAKAHLFSLSGEPAHYSAGSSATVARLTTTGTPVGMPGVSVAPMICYDLRFPELWRHAALAGAELFSLSACWPATRSGHWRSLAIARAIENQAVVVACNRTGSEPNTQYSGGSLIIGPAGEIIAEASDKPEVLAAEVDIGETRSWRRKFPALRDIRRNWLGRCRVNDCGEVAPDC
ncbi:MAG: carbon-nitrogen family hydrolase [Planctomycetes bacterium]|nr:carbon-nitrogen family hydrolase [Planctomycetota bacterium]